MKTHENKEKICEITFEQVKKRTLNIQDPKYDLKKALSIF